MRTLWIGDSHLVGMTTPIKDLCASRGWAGLISGHVGWSTRRWVESGELVDLVTRANPDLVIVLLGTNDDPPNPPAMRELLAQAPGVKSLWVGPFWTDEYDRTFASAASHYVSGHALAVGLPFTSASTHLTAANYNVLAQRVVAEVAARSRSPMGPFLLGLGIAGTLIITLSVVLDRGRETVWEKST